MHYLLIADCKLILVSLRSSDAGESVVNENEQGDTQRGSTHGNDDVSKEDGKAPHVAPVWLAESTPNEFTVC